MLRTSPEDVKDMEPISLLMDMFLYNRHTHTHPIHVVDKDEIISFPKSHMSTHTHTRSYTQTHEFAKKHVSWQIYYNI